MGIVSAMVPDRAFGQEKRFFDLPAGYSRDLILSFSLQESWISSQEPGYDRLSQANTRLEPSIHFGYPLSLSVYSALSWTSPSEFSDYWYRYRGFFALDSQVGLSYRNSDRFGDLPFRVGILGGAALAKYYESDSYFYYPQIEMRADIPTLRLSRNTRLDLGARAQAMFRPDIDSIGFGLYTAVSWFPRRGSDDQ